MNRYQELRALEKALQAQLAAVRRELAEMTSIDGEMQDGLVRCARCGARSMRAICPSCILYELRARG